MNPMTCFAATSILALSAATNQPIVIYESDDPFGGVMGVFGFDVDSSQSVAIRFTPDRDCSLESIQVWLWNNDPSGQSTEATLTLREDALVASTQGSVPSEAPLEEFSIEIPFTGFANPHLFDCVAERRLILTAGRSYWVVLESDAAPALNPVWAAGQPGTGFGAIRFPADDPWHSYEGAVGATIVWGFPATTAGPTPGGHVPTLRQRRPQNPDPTRCVPSLGE